MRSAYLPECGSYMKLVVRALRHRKTVSSSFTLDVVTVEELADREASFESGGCFEYAYIDIHEESGEMTGIKRVCNDGSLATLHTFDSPSRLKVKVRPVFLINNSNFVFWGEEDVGWLGLILTGQASPSHSPPTKKPAMPDFARADTDSKLHVWRTNEVRDCHSGFSACTNCGLLVFAHSGVASVTVRKLTPGKSNVHEVGNCTLKLAESHMEYPDENGYLFDIKSFFPKECVRGVCGSHYLIVEDRPNNTLSLHMVPADFSCISELPNLKLPREIVCVDFVEPSTDGSVVAFWADYEEQYQLWEPKSGRVISVVTPLNTDFSPLATGKLYSILTDWKEMAVIETYTGKVLLKGIEKAERVDCFPHPNQTWLSTFDTPGPLPVALLYQVDHIKFIGYIVARRSV